ncbi:MAG: tautomerase family protein [Fusobacteriaceae bacterium]|nr:tautomerase family protein [Fusobacteriaceae bacterium]MBN2837906.1 tautomerase family protein [Fusobacteriaceae bacterium]
MGQIKVYGNKEFIEKEKSKIIEVIHSSMVDIFKLPKDKKFYRFFSLEKENYIYPEGRSEKYIIIEIIIFSGRKIETRKNLIKKIFENFVEKLNMQVEDIEITIIESSKENWGIRGFVGDELKLNYKVEQ